MDWMTIKENGAILVKKYKYLIFALLFGLFLMCMPAAEETETYVQTTVDNSEINLQEALSDILSKIHGAGKVEVLLTCAEGEKTLFQTDVNISSDRTQQDTVLISGADRTETGLIQQVNPPVYLGAIIICQGADNAAVKLNIVKAVMSVTGLTSDHITVLKMK